MRCLGVWLAVALCLGALPEAGAAAAEVAAEFTVGAAAAVIAGQKVDLELPVRMVAGEAWAPLRPAAEALGARVTWDPERYRVSAATAGRTLEVQVDAATAWLDGTPLPLAAPVFLAGDRTHVPLAVLAALAGAQGRLDTAAGRFTLGPAGPVEVRIGPDGFSPGAVAVSAGTRLRWVNQSRMPHQVALPGLALSPVLAPGEAWEFTAGQPGTYPWHCTVHPAFRGVLTISP